MPRVQTRGASCVASGLLLLWTGCFSRLLLSTLIFTAKETTIITGIPSQARRLTTPQILHGALAALCLGALLLFLVTLAGVRQHRQAVKTVGQDSAPSIIAAQSIKAGLADMDANVANELMARPGQNAQSIEGYGQRCKEVGDSLLGAAENITYGNAERQPLQTMQVGLGDYESWATRARLLHERREDAASLSAYRSAQQTLETVLFPAADALTTANTTVLDREYQQASATSARLTALALFGGATLLALLIATQVFLSRRMRRTLNPALLGATLVTLWFLAYTVRAFHAASDHLRVAKEDAFTSIQALWQARAVAYDANTDESRWLLDHANADAYQTAFYAKTTRLLQPSGGQSYESVAAATQGTLPKDAKGYLAQELGNITFAGEREAAQDMVRAYGVYYADDKRIRDMENGGRHDAAIAFCVSMAPGDSNYAFSEFDKALGKTLDINRHAFDDAVAQGFRDLNGMDLLCALVAGGIAILAFVGLRPRLREYAR